MSDRTTEFSVLAATLVAEGLFLSGGDVDVGFWVQRLHRAEGAVCQAAVCQALEEIAAAGFLTAEDRWECPDCQTQSALSEASCSICGRPRSVDDPIRREFVRPARPPGRDPAALFLIHGMNTVGEWQQSLAWKIALLYGYSLPVFVFKFGRDWLSPLSRVSQRRRVRQLGDALRSAQEDLQQTGRNTRCDVIAHSFGTLLFTQLLEHQSFSELQFGRVILSGSIAHRQCPWSEWVASGRLELVLNHRAGRDIWVPSAPWFFPGVSASGAAGFDDSTYVVDCVSPSFGHSDFFKRSSFDAVLRLRWAAFLNGHWPPLASPTPDAVELDPKCAPRQDRRFWIGRLVLALGIVSGTWALLELLELLGGVARLVLQHVGL